MTAALAYLVMLCGWGLVILMAGCATVPPVPTVADWNASGLTRDQKIQVLQLMMMRQGQAPQANYGDVYLQSYCQARGGVYSGGQCMGQGPAVPSPSFGTQCSSQANIFGGFDTVCSR